VADERRLDGNAIGGMMLELFGVEMTTATEVCRTCGTADLLAQTEVYMDAPGTVVRCTHCQAVLMRVVRGRDRTWLDLSGLRSIELPNS
jgi:Family of unknown function (DUF6510)